MKKIFNKEIRRINKRIKEIDHALMMYGYDCYGSSAFSNIQAMKKLEKEKKKLLGNKSFYMVLAFYASFVSL